MEVDVIKCPECDASVSENWMKRHLDSGCEVGAKGSRRQEYLKTYGWGKHRPADGQKIRVWNRPLDRWEEMVYFMDRGGILFSTNDDWSGTVKRFSKFLYPVWSE